MKSLRGDLPTDLYLNMDLPTFYCVPVQCLQGLKLRPAVLRSTFFAFVLFRYFSVMVLCVNKLRTAFV